MRTLLFLGITLGFLLFYSCNESNERKVTTRVVNNPNSAIDVNNAGVLPVMEFVKMEHDFGQLIQGERVSYAFKFTNTGGSDLVITSANAGCGCTVPNYPKHPIKPNESGVIEVAFNSSGRNGFQSQRVSLVANTQPNTLVLNITANIVIP